MAPNEWTIRERFEDGFEPYPEFCDFAAVQYALILAMFNLPSGEVIEEECQCRGDAGCLFRIRWREEETDEQKAEKYRVRAEVAEARLEQIQGMISDLATNERHEEVLQGFVGSTLRTAVGAGGALLALAPRDGRDREIYSEGFLAS